MVIVKKWMVLGLAAITSSVVLYAEGMYDGNRIIGIEIASSKIEADTLIENDHSSRDVEFGIRLGAQNEEWRTMLMINYYNSSEDDQKYFKAQATFDYYFAVTSALKPFVGINAGYMNYTTSNPAGDDSDGGFLYGGQIGAAYEVNNSLQLDISYRYSFCSSDWVDHTEGIVFGVNYLF